MGTVQCEEKGVVANRVRGTIRGMKYTGKDWGILRNMSPTLNMRLLQVTVLSAVYKEHL